MAFDPEAKLSDVLAGGYHLNAKLQALLGRPLDSRSQEEAMAYSQQLSRVFMVSLSMLEQPNDSKRTQKMAPEIRTGDSFGVCTLAKDKLIRREGVTSHKNIREAEFTRKEVTSSPRRKDGYHWQKYGQKNIQNFSFMRYYFRCHDRRCKAKKKVQQQDGSSSDAPVFEVTYVNEHTCQHFALANNNSCSKSRPATTATGQSTLRAGDNTSRNGGALFDLLHSISENEAIVSCLAAVISGTAPSSPGAEPSAPASDPLPAYVWPQLPDGKQTPSADGGSMADGATMTMMMDTGFSWDPSEVMVMDLFDDVHMDAARFVDTA